MKNWMEVTPQNTRIYSSESFKKLYEATEKAIAAKIAELTKPTEDYFDGLNATDKAVAEAKKQGYYQNMFGLFTPGQEIKKVIHRCDSPYSAKNWYTV